MKKMNLILILAMLLLFVTAVSRMESGRRAEGKRQLENVIRRTAVSCYASEGIYPPNVEYMKERYALQFNEKAYTVHYEIFASNLMPEITVVEKSYE